MDKYGLSPGTLKGELFSILLTQGNSGMKVSELAKSTSVSLYFPINLETIDYQLLDVTSIYLARVSFL